MPWAHTICYKDKKLLVSMLVLLANLLPFSGVLVVIAV